jgi:hypothetical protein
MKRKVSLIEWLMGRPSKDDSVNENRVFSDIDPKSVRTPTTDGLNCCKICTRFRKGSGTARSDRLTGDLFRENFAKTGQEPIASWY